MAKGSQSRNGDEEEIEVFRAFAKASHLPIIPDSIEKRTPPEPDILCRLEDGETLAFELVEICQPQNARFFGSAFVVSQALEETYQALPPELRNRFTSRFANKPLSFSFSPDVSINRIRRILPRVFAELVDQPEKHGQFQPFSNASQGILMSVRVVGRVDVPGRPSFNVAGTFQADDVVTESVHAKLSRKYTTPHPIELLAYFGDKAWGRSTDWKEPLIHLLKSHGCGPFRRVWVLGWYGISFTYPAVSDLRTHDPK